ncbi:MAG: 50S ribosomal protein L35ae [Nanobdellota archaeon]
MEGTITNFRMGRHHQKDSHMVVTVKDVDTKEKAEKLLGKKTVYKTEAGKELNGEVRASHGNSGAVRVVFEKGMPGQAVGKKVEIQ